MQRSVKYIFLGGAFTIIGLTTIYLIRRYGYTRLGDDTDKGLVGDTYENRLKSTDFSKVTFRDYNINDIPTLNDIDVAAAYYVTNHGHSNYSNSEIKKMIEVNAKALAEIQKRKLWKTIWLNDPYFGAGNRDYYNKTGEILGNQNI